MGKNSGMNRTQRVKIENGRSMANAKKKKYLHVKFKQHQHEDKWYNTMQLFEVELEWERDSNYIKYSYLDKYIKVGRGDRQWQQCKLKWNSKFLKIQPDKNLI